MIVAKTIFTEKEIVQGYMLHWRQRSRFIRFAPYFGAGLMFLYVSLTIRDQRPLSQLVPMLIVGLFLVLLPQIIRFVVKMEVRKSPNINSEVHWQFDEAGLASRGKDFEFSQTWGSMRKACVNEAGLLIYPESGALHWIPVSSFATPHDFALVKEYIFEGVQDCSYI